MRFIVSGVQMLPEDVQALLGGILFFFVMSALLLTQKIKASEVHGQSQNRPIEVVRFLK